MMQKVLPKAAFCIIFISRILKKTAVNGIKSAVRGKSLIKSLRAERSML